MFRVIFQFVIYAILTVWCILKKPIAIKAIAITVLCLVT